MGNSSRQNRRRTYGGSLVKKIHGSTPSHSPARPRPRRKVAWSPRPQRCEVCDAALVRSALPSASSLQWTVKSFERATMSESRARARRRTCFGGVCRLRGGAGDSSDGRGDLTAPRGRGFHRHRAAITAGTFDVLGTLHGFVAILAMAESAHPAGGHHLQVLPDASNARDHPFIIRTHPAHAEQPPTRPAWLRLSIRLSPLCAGCGDTDGGGWRRRSAVWPPASRAGSAGSARPPVRAIPRSSRGQQTPRERPGSVADVGGAVGGWVRHARGSCVRPLWTLLMSQVFQT